MSSPALASLHKGDITGLLSGCRGIRDMQRQLLLPYRRRYSCQVLGSDPHLYQTSWSRRLADAPGGGYLAAAGLFVAHEGERLDGLGRHDNSSRRKAQWGHRWLSSALVYPHEDAYVLRAEPLLSKVMATPAYPWRTAGKARLALVAEIPATGYSLRGVVADTEFTSRQTLANLKEPKIALLGRFRRCNNVIYQAQDIKAKALAAHFPPGKSRDDPKLGVYAKRPEVALEDVGKVD